MSQKPTDDDFDVEDETDDVSPHVAYDIATYPSDLTLSVIHEMWKNKDITIPAFQRNFVWNIRQSSLLIESFLLGLPVPQVFFYIDSENQNLVIDGQQRIMSIIFFFEGYFGHENLQGRRQVFRLSGLASDSPYAGRRFEDLTLNDQRKFRGSVLRAVNIKQLSPANQSNSMFHIFERLNTGGTPLRPQEIRNCVFHGKIVDMLHELNEYPSWRSLLAKSSLEKHQRDVEMVLRVFAMTERGNSYEKPMKDFLNSQMKRHVNASDSVSSIFEAGFKRVTDLMVKKLPAKPFHVRGPINLAALDSILSVLINAKSVPDNLVDRYHRLLQDADYKDAIFFNTSDGSVVKERLRLSKKYLLG